MITSCVWDFPNNNTSSHLKVQIHTSFIFPWDVVPPFSHHENVSLISWLVVRLYQHHTCLFPCLRLTPPLNVLESRLKEKEINSLVEITESHIPEYGSQPRKHRKLQTGGIFKRAIVFKARCGAKRTLKRRKKGKKKNETSIKVSEVTD